jgi:hypothetical protein
MNTRLCKTAIWVGAATEWWKIMKAVIIRMTYFTTTTHPITIKTKPVVGIE